MHLFDVKSTERLTPNTVLLTLKAKRRKDQLRFQPGQYAVIGFKHGGRPSLMRCFSIASSPNKPDELQFAMRIYGDFTAAVANLDAGDTVFVRGPFGEFMIDERYDRNVILMAGGIGVTPFMSMIRYAAEVQAALPITLLYSCQSEDNIPFYDELRELEHRNPRFKVIFFVTSGSTDKLKSSRVFNGRINQTQLAKLTGQQYNRFTYFVCGPKGFTNNMTNILLTNDTEPGRILTEEFTPSSQVKNIATSPGYSISSWTYALTGASMILAVGFVMAIDLARAIPKIANADTVQSVSSSPAASGQSTGSSSANTAQNPDTSNNTGSDSSQTESTPSSPSQSEVQTQYYQSPVTSVS